MEPSRALRLALLFLTSLRFVAAIAPFDAYVINGNTLNNLTVAINVPADSDDDLYFHFQAPAGQQWSAFGFGDQMAGSLIFVVYAKTDNYNVTVSPRLGTGHTQPQFTDSVAVTLLPGTSIVDGNYIVNAKCTGCRKWQGGQLDVTSTAQNMIWAVGPSDSFVQSDDLNYSIAQHDPRAHRTFTLDMQKATGEAGVPNLVENPIVGAHPPITEGETSRHLSIAAHAVLLIAAFVFVFPFGYILLRLFNRVWIHMIVQTIGLILVVAGAALGIAISQQQKISPQMNTVHQALGLFVFGLTMLAWCMGLIGHQLFKKRGIPTIPTMIHRGVGPLTVLLGLINVGIGFHFAGDTRRVIPFYITVLIIFTLLGGFIFLINKRRMRSQATQTPAAQNFNEAYLAAAAMPAHAHAESVPMQTFTPGGKALPQITVQPIGKLQ